MNKLLLTALGFILGILLIDCAAKPVDLQKQNPKLYKEIVRDYFVASEEYPGKSEVLKFNEDENKSISGRVSNFNISTCTWFLDKKVKDKNDPDYFLNAPKKLNINCGGKYYIVEFNKNSLQASKLKYKGAYRPIFKRLSKAAILEASCSFTYTGKSDEGDDRDENNTSVECFPYPYDLNRYAKEQNREVIAGYFLYTDKEDTLEKLLASTKDEKENDKIIQELKKEFSDETKRKEQSKNPILKKNYVFNSSEYIDFRETNVVNSRGNELQEKINKLLESNLNDPANKEKLKDAIEDYRNCGERCVSKEKETLAFFEIKSSSEKRRILLIKKLKSKSELGNYKRFSFYNIEAQIASIDFSPKGEIEKLYLDPPVVEEVNPKPAESKSDIQPVPSKPESKEESVQPDEPETEEESK